MNAILLTVLALQGAEAAAIYGGGPESAYSAAPVEYGSAGYGQSGYGVAGGYGEACDACQGGRHGRHRQGDGFINDWCGPMPQSCYNPSFGCYPSTRFMHRYPAFHNYYYRKAYNYRHYSDYPWHAGLHEPTSMFSYHVPGEGASQPLPVPVPATSHNAQPNATRSASAGDTFYR